MSLVTEPQGVSIATKPPALGAASTVTVDSPPGAVKLTVMMRALLITIAIVLFSVSITPSTSPVHFSKLYPSEGTAVSVTTVLPAYVELLQSGGSYVTSPPHLGLLTTVSLYAPQAQALDGTVSGITSPATANRTVSRTSRRIPPVCIFSLSPHRPSCCLRDAFQASLVPIITACRRR